VFRTGSGKHAGRYSRVVHKNVEAPIARLKVIVCSLGIPRLGNVELEHVSIHARSTQFCDSLFSLRKVTRSNHNFYVRILQFESRLESESAIAAGDESNFLSH